MKFWIIKMIIFLSSWFTVFLEEYSWAALKKIYRICDVICLLYTQRSCTNCAHTNQKQSIQIWTLKFIIEEIGNWCAKFNYLTMQTTLGILLNILDKTVIPSAICKHLSVRNILSLFSSKRHVALFSLQRDFWPSYLSLVLQLLICNCREEKLQKNSYDMKVYINIYSLPPK